MTPEQINKLLDERCEVKLGDKVRYIPDGFFEHEPSGQSFWWLVFVIAFVILISFTGCGAAHKPPKIGAPPQWKQDTPFGGHWDCDGPYEYNFETQNCEVKEKTK